MFSLSAAYSKSPTITLPLSWCYGQTSLDGKPWLQCINITVYIMVHCVMQAIGNIKAGSEASFPLVAAVEAVEAAVAVSAAAVSAAAASAVAVI
jgi:hypothetical protein